MSLFHDANNTFSMTTAPPTAPPSPPVPPDPTRALPSSPPFIPIGQKKYTQRSIFLPRGVYVWPGFGVCVCAAVVGCLVGLHEATMHVKCQCHGGDGRWGWCCNRFEELIVTSPTRFCVAQCFRSFRERQLQQPLRLQTTLMQT